MLQAACHEQSRSYLEGEPRLQGTMAERSKAPESGSYESHLVFTGASSNLAGVTIILPSYDKFIILSQKRKRSTVVVLGSLPPADRLACHIGAFKPNCLH
jgi:hypothetical protein